MIGAVDDFSTVDDAVDALNSTILSAADSSISKTKGGLKTKNVCPGGPRTVAATGGRKTTCFGSTAEVPIYSIRVYESLSEISQICQGIAPTVIAKLYLKHQCHTPIVKIWKKIDKIRGKYATSSPSILNGPNGQVTDPFEVTNIFGQSFSSISRGFQHPDFLQIKDRYTPPCLGW